MEKITEAKEALKANEETLQNIEEKLGKEPKPADAEELENQKNDLVIHIEANEPKRLEDIKQQLDRQKDTFEKSAKNVAPKNAKAEMKKLCDNADIELTKLHGMVINPPKLNPEPGSKLPTYNEATAPKKGGK